MQPGQIGVALNAPQTVAYVVRLIELSPSNEVLWPQFEVDDFRTYAAIGREDQQQIVRAWMQEIKTSAGFEWVPGRKADQSPQPQQPDEE